jgi:hypothetical protein
MKTLLKTLLIATLTICTLEAKSGGFSSSSSYKSTPSYSSSYKSTPSSSYKSTPPKSVPSTPKYTPNKPGSAAHQTSARVGSKVEVSRYQEAVKSGKAFTTRESAVSDFKTKNATIFTNKFTTEPTKRPDYIPTNYNSGGKSYDVVYNPTSGGYGYWNGGGPGLGTWMVYDTLSDMAMMNTLMSRQNYYVGTPVVATAQPVHYDNSKLRLALIVLTVGFCVGGLVLFVFIR